MLFNNPTAQWWARWLGIPPIAVIAAFLAFNLVTPFRLMHKGMWGSDTDAAMVVVVVAIDALLILAPLIVVVVFAAWLTAPAYKIATVRVTQVILAAGCGVAMLGPLQEGHWQGAMVLAFGALAAVLTGGGIVRYEQRQAASTGAAEAPQPHGQAGGQ